MLLRLSSKRGIGALGALQHRGEANRSRAHVRGRHDLLFWKRRLAPANDSFSTSGPRQLPLATQAQASERGKGGALEEANE